jgi:hypothetical protein
MGGNDKLTTSRETWDRTGVGGVQRFVFQTGQFDPVLTFYDISAPGLHLPGTGKNRGVAQRRQSGQPRVRLPWQAICNPQRGGYHQRVKFSFFFR